VKHMCW